MADFPEKEINENTEEFSTVFSDPTVHRDIKLKKKRLLPKILAGVLALGVLIGTTIAIVKFIPATEEDNESSSVTQTITVKNIETDKLASVSITNKNGTVDFYSETEKQDDKETVSWYIKQVDKALTSSSSIEDVIASVSDIYATRKITQKTAEECGFTNPIVKCTVTPKEDNVYTLLIGDKSPDNSGYYLMLDDSIYLVGEEVYTSLQFGLLDFASTESIAGFGTDMEEFDSLTISGNNFPETVEIVSNDGQISEYFAYLVKSPQLRLAKNVESVFNIYKNGISVMGAYAYDTTFKSLQAVGLDKPDIITKMTSGEKNIIYKFSLQEDGNYAVIGSDSSLIHKVSASALQGFAELKATDYYETTIFMTHIDEVAVFAVNTKDKSYSFNIAKNEEEDNYDVTINGKKLKSQNFQNFYSECISVHTQDFSSESITGTADISFDITHKDNSKSVIEFKKVNATRYQCYKDGVDMGKVTASTLNNIVKLAEKTANGETIEQ